MLSNHLFHFALIHEEYQKSGDIFTGMLPLFTHIISKNSGRVFDPDTFCKDIENFYGIKMHRYVAESFIPKFIKAGLLIDESIDKKYRKYVFHSTTEVTDKSLENDFKFLFESFKDFASSILNALLIDHEKVDFDTELSRRLARSEIIEHLSDDDLETIYKSKKENEKTEKFLDYIFARFVQEIDSRGGKAKKLLVEAYSGAILAEVVLSIREPDFDRHTLENKKFFIDAPVIMDCLGYNEDSAVKASKELINQLISFGATVTTHDFYIDEIRQTIDAALDNHNNRGNRNSNLDRFIFKNPDRIAEVRATRDSIFEALSKIGFRTEDKYVSTTLKLDSQRARSLHCKVLECLGEYRNAEAKDRDASAVTMNVIDNNYKSHQSIKNVNSLFITNNNQLVFNAKHLLEKERIHSKLDFSSIMSSRNLAVFLWVLAGGKSSNISSLTLLSNCNRAIQHHADLFSRVTNFLKKLPADKAELFEGIVKNKRALIALMDRTAGDPNIITEENACSMIDQIIDDIRNKAEADTREHAAKLDSVQSERESIRKELQEQKEKNNSTLQDLEKLKEDKIRLENEIVKSKHESINLHKKAVEKMLYFVLSVLLGISILYISFDLFPSEIKIGDTIVGNGTTNIIKGFLIILTVWKIPEYTLAPVARKITDILYKQ